MRIIPGLRNSGPRALACLVLAGLPAAAQRRAPDPEPEPVPPLSGALYVDGWEVRKQIIVDPMTLQEIVGLGIDEYQPVTPEQLEAVAPKVMAALADGFEVWIDGDSGDFTAEPLRFIVPDMENFELLGAGDAVLPWDFMVVASWSVPLPALGSEIRAEWKFFPGGLDRVPLSLADPVTSQTIMVTESTGRFDPEPRLSAELRDAPEPPPVPEERTMTVPWLSAVFVITALGLAWERRATAAVACAGLAVAGWFVVRPEIRIPGKQENQIGQEEAKVIAKRLLEGVYHGFNFRDESAQYDVLAGVLAGEALEETFLEIRRTGRARDEDGAEVRVRKVSVERAEPTPLAGGGGFRVDCEWTAAGRIGHWGHYHERLNVYTADLRIEVIDGRWKATDFVLKDRERQ